jgi:hypothetical protein
MFDQGRQRIRHGQRGHPRPRLRARVTDPSHFRFPRSLQAWGSGSGKRIKNHDGAPIDYRAHAHRLRSWVMVPPLPLEEYFPD